LVNVLRQIFWNNLLLRIRHYLGRYFLVAEMYRLPSNVRDIVRSKEVQWYAGEYDSAREYLVRWAASVAEESDQQHGWRGEEVGGLWSSTRHSGWEEMSELGGFEVLSVCPFPLWCVGVGVLWTGLMVDCTAGACGMGKSC
jgi:hypothetical protein